MKLIKLVGAGLLSAIILTACGDAKPAEQAEQAAVVDEIRLKHIDNSGGMHFTVRDDSGDLSYIDGQTAAVHGIDGLQVGNVIEVISDSDGAFKEVAGQ